MSNAHVSKVLTTVALCAFAAALSIRAVDPVLPQIASDFSMSMRSAATLTSAFAITYAIVQPALGALADLFGKTRLAAASIFVLVVGMIMSAFAPNFETLMVTRVICGAAGGGVFPVALALAGDLVPIEERQVAIGRLIGAAMAGNLAGAAVGGVIGDFSGWRWVFIALALVIFFSFVRAVVVFRTVKRPDRPKPDLQTLRAGYRSIFANPNAKICFSAVCIEGIIVFGLMPFVAALMAGWGEPRLSIAGMVIAGFALGGVAYSLIVGRILPLLGEARMMIIGGAIVASQLILFAFGMPWPLQAAAFLVMGIGFYMLHGSLQLFATELAPNARASAVALHAFSFFCGHALGPIIYGYSFSHTTVMMTLVGAAGAIAALGIACALLLKPRETGA